MAKKDTQKFPSPVGECDFKLFACVPHKQPEWARFPSPVGECDFKYSRRLVWCPVRITGRFRPLSGNVILNTKKELINAINARKAFPSPVGECDFKC